MAQKTAFLTVLLIVVSVAGCSCQKSDHFEAIAFAHGKEHIERQSELDEIMSKLKEQGVDCLDKKRLIISKLLDAEATVISEFTYELKDLTIEDVEALIDFDNTEYEQFMWPSMPPDEAMTSFYTCDVRASHHEYKWSHATKTEIWINKKSYKSSKEIPSHSPQGVKTVSDSEKKAIPQSPAKPPPPRPVFPLPSRGRSN